MTNTIHLSVEYASQALKEVPFGYIDKTVCGCGFTTVAIENDKDCVIAVPSIPLIVNKIAQYPKDKHKFHLFGVDGSVSVEQVNEYIEDCDKNDKHIKIMVTYDGVWKVKHLFREFRRLQLIIDESQHILSSASLKSNSGNSNDVISSMLEFAETIKERTSFISATPVPLSYLPEWISNIPNYKYTWSNTIKTIPHLMKRTFPANALRKELIGQIEKSGSVTIDTIKASKLIIFLNSVTQIVNTIKNCKLKVEDVAIIAADTVLNDTKISGYNRLTDPRNLPKYTFITSTGFEGIDLYDEDAVTVVISNSSVKHQMIDLLTDFKQTVSRQRVKSNPNYGKFVFIYNQCIFDESEEDLLKELNNWEIGMKMLVNNANSEYREAFLSTMIDHKAFHTYCNVNKDNVWTLNENLFNADRYFILEVRKQYKEGFDIRSEVDGIDVSELDIVVIPKDVSYQDVAKKAKEEVKRLVEEHKGKTLTKQYIVDNINYGVYSIYTDYTDLIRELYTVTGKILVNYDEAKNALHIATSSLYGSISVSVTGSFVVGKEYSRAQVKKVLSAIYAQANIKRVAKHSDLFEFFGCREKTIKGERFVEIVSRNSSKQ